MKYYLVLAKMLRCLLLHSLSVRMYIGTHSAFVMQVGFPYQEPLHAISPRTSR